VVGADDFAGYCKCEGIIGGVTAGAGLRANVPLPVPLPVEVHAEATDTDTGVWFNVKDLVDFGRQVLQ
jgi:hypothetical protein